MSCRIEGGVLYKHWYNSENRLESIKQYAGSDCAEPGTLQQTWSFYYDGDGNRVKEEYIVDGQVMYTRHLLGGGMYEFTDDGTDVTTRQYYNVGGMMVAMKEWVNEGSKTTNFFASDHLSSTSLVMDSSGNLLSENRYMPFGETRTISGTTNISETDFGYTGQRDYSDDFGLMDYRYRFLSTSLGRFTQPDTVVPEPGNSQAWNRYSYTYNNPLKYNDPSGNSPYCVGATCDFGNQNESNILPIIKREEWGAHEPGSFGDQNSENSEGLFGPGNEDGYKVYQEHLDDVLDTVVIHHEGDDATYDVKTVQEAQMNDGYYDIAYHFIIDQDGNIYEGRDIVVRGSSAFPNSGKIGVLWLGDFNPGFDISDPRNGQDDPSDDISGPTDAQFNATVELIKYLNQEYGIDQIYGHGELPGNNTACPGAYAMPAVDMLRKEIYLE